MESNSGQLLLTVYGVRRMEDGGWMMSDGWDDSESEREWCTGSHGVI